MIESVEMSEHTNGSERASAGETSVRSVDDLMREGLMIPFAGSGVSGDVVRKLAQDELVACREALAQILTTAGERDSSNTLVPYNRLSMRFVNVASVLNVMRSVHPEAEIREACEQAEQEVARFGNELSLHRELYEAVSTCSPDFLEADGKRLLKHLVRDFRRAGVDRDEATREEIRELRARLVRLGQEFTRNIVEDTRSITFPPEDLAGMPTDYVRDHPADESGEVRVTTDYPDYNPFMTYATSDERRRELYVEFRKRAHPSNLEVLDSILSTRHELATKLGYPSWAAYVSEDKMIKRADAIREFIDRVATIAEKRAREEYEILIEEKRKTDPAATTVNDWEKAFLEERVKADRYHVDSKEVRAYFEYTRVKDGIVRLAESLFGVRFVASPEAPSWHADVEVLDVLEGDRCVGRVYLDMHPRQGKFKHAAMFPVVPGVADEQIPVAALVCNFPDPSASKSPALMEHGDVVTFFHEFGHLLHHLFARDLRWVEFSGTGTEWDFVEVPSQLFEEWAWEYEVLKEFSVHHESGERIPEEIVERIRGAKDFGHGLWVRHQMFYAAVSLCYYNADPTNLDTTAEMKKLQERYSLFDFVDGTYFQTSFGHLHDYSALYYTYMWSLVIATDLASVFKSHGILNTEIASRYREKILAPGGSSDAIDLTRDFLGRDYAYDAFEKLLASGF